MTTTATAADVAARLGRPLAADEETLAATLLGDAEHLIASRLPNKKLDEEIIDSALVRQVAGQAVARVLRNPDGYRQESVGGVSYSIDTRAAAGFLTILDEEWRLLGLAPKGSAGAFAPAIGHAELHPDLWRSLWP